MGTVRVKVLPCPQVLATVKSPPSMRAICCEMASPKSRAAELSWNRMRRPGLNGWNSDGRTSARMPMPVSITSIRTAGWSSHQSGRNDATMRTLALFRELDGVADQIDRRPAAGERRR